MSFYSYSLDANEDGSIAYSFVTKTSTEYRAYFYPAKDYSEYVQNYTHLTNHGYICGFTKVEPNEDKPEPFDHRVKATIQCVMIDFIKEVGNKAILLYHCDYHDGRQEKRNNSFKKWNEEAKDKMPMFIETTSITEVDEEGNPVLTNYLGLLITADNPDKEEILQEFHSVKEDLIREK